MANVVGLIFSNIHDKNVPELTKLRTMASVPFGCRYRLIDFTLSNMVHSGIEHVGVITHYNYQSLMDHLGSGKSWDLARRSGGIQILPPFITAFANPGASLYSTRLEALRNSISFISGCTEDYVVLSDCDVICNIDLGDMIDAHIASRADATMMIKKTFLTGDVSGVYVTESDENDRLTSVKEFTERSGGFRDVCTNIWVMNRRFLETAVLDAEAHGYTAFIKDIIQRNLENCSVNVYRHEGYFATVDSMQSYYMCSMDLLNEDVRHELFGNTSRPVYTKVRNSPPAVYSEGAAVHNSLIADGCVINGKVENSILFRGVRVGRNTHVKNCILMQDTIVGENCTLNAVITDKNAVIRDGRNLSGYETLPFYISKYAQV